MVNLRKKVKSNDLYREYVNILNGILRLSPREAEVFSLLLNANELSPEDVNNTGVRKAIKASLGMSDATLSRNLGVLKRKGIIYRLPNGRWAINNNLLPDEFSNIVEVVYTLEVSNEGLAEPTIKGFSEEA